MYCIAFVIFCIAHIVNYLQLRCNLSRAIELLSWRCMAVLLCCVAQRNLCCMAVLLYSDVFCCMALLTSTPKTFSNAHI